MPQGSLVPRSFFDFPSLRIPSIFDDVDDLLSFPDVTTTGAQGGLTVSEDDKNVYVEASIPGINPADVEITMDRGVLWIRGEAQEEEKDKRKKFYRRAQRAFSYQVAVPGDVDPNKEPEASCANGLLTLIFPKSPQAQPKRIAIKSEDGQRKQIKAKEEK
jgi:HSP20 family protein